MRIQERAPSSVCVPACPRSSIFPSHSAFLYDIIFAFPCIPPFLFRVPSMCGGGGATHHMRALFVYGRIRRAGSTRHRATTHPPSSRVHHGVRVYWRVQIVSRPQSPPSTSPLSTRRNCVISSQEREFSVPILLRSAFPRPCIKFAFPRARVPKIPGTR